MNEEELATLSANLRRYGKNTAFNTETGDPVLTSNRTNPDLTYVAPRDFVTRLEQAGKTISPVTLEIQEAGADATTAYRAALLEARAILGAAYGFAPENLGDNDGLNGW